MISFFSAHGTTANEIDYGQEDNRAQKRHEKRSDIERARGDWRSADERAENKPAEQSSSDTYDNVENYPLLSVGAHYDACQPTDDTSNYQYYEQAHYILRYI
jgi:hypothetical protein